MANRLSNYPLLTDSQGEQTNPTTATVMADTGALGNAYTSDIGAQTYYKGGGGIYEVTGSASATATAEFVIQLRNAANGANVGDTQVFYCGANTTVPFFFKFEVENGQRIRVMMNTNLTGDAVVDITAQRVA